MKGRGNTTRRHSVAGWERERVGRLGRGASAQPLLSVKGVSAAMQRYDGFLHRLVCKVAALCQGPLLETEFPGEPYAIGARRAVVHVSGLAHGFLEQADKAHDSLGTHNQIVLSGLRHVQR